VGKTRLALRLVADVLSDYADGIWLVELGSLAEPGLVPNRVADVPPELRVAVSDQPLTVRTWVLHSIEHSALHLGHIQFTRTLLMGSASG
jgi:hypothetical protein